MSFKEMGNSCAKITSCHPHQPHTARIFWRFRLLPVQTMQGQRQMNWPSDWSREATAEAKRHSPPRLVISSLNSGALDWFDLQIQHSVDATLNGTTWFQFIIQLSKLVGKVVSRARMARDLGQGMITSWLAGDGKVVDRGRRDRFIKKLYIELEWLEW